MLLVCSRYACSCAFFALRFGYPGLEIRLEINLKDRRKVCVFFGDGKRFIRVLRETPECAEETEVPGGGGGAAFEAQIRRQGMAHSARYRGDKRQRFPTSPSVLSEEGSWMKFTRRVPDVGTCHSFPSSVQSSPC